MRKSNHIKFFSGIFFFMSLIGCNGGQKEKNKVSLVEEKSIEDAHVKLIKNNDEGRVDVFIDGELLLLIYKQMRNLYCIQ